MNYNSNFNKSLFPLYQGKHGELVNPIGKFTVDITYQKLIEGIENKIGYDWHEFLVIDPYKSNPLLNFLFDKNLIQITNDTDDLKNTFVFLNSEDFDNIRSKSNKFGVVALVDPTESLLKSLLDFYDLRILNRLNLKSEQYGRYSYLFKDVRPSKDKKLEEYKKETPNYDIHFKINMYIGTRENVKREAGHNSEQCEKIYNWLVNNNIDYVSYKTMYGFQKQGLTILTSNTKVLKIFKLFGVDNYDVFVHETFTLEDSEHFERIYSKLS